jgi:hypothetical protein
MYASEESVAQHFHGHGGLSRSFQQRNMRSYPHAHAWRFGAEEKGRHLWQGTAPPHNLLRF